MNRTEFPDDLAGVLRLAADALPAYHGDLDEVQARGRAARRRRTVAVAGVPALAAAVALAVPVAIAGQSGGPPSSPAADPSTVVSTDEPAQRLLVGQVGWVEYVNDDGGMTVAGIAQGETAREALERYRALPGAVGVIGNPAELRLDGSLADLDLDLSGIDAVLGLAAMPDGRLAVIGLVDQLPGVARDDGPCVAGVEFRLMVVEPGGSVSVSRNVRETCHTLSLLGADAETAYLVRDSELIAHDLATGEERPLLDSPEMFGQGARGSVADGRVVTVATEPVNTYCTDGAPKVRIVVRVAGPDDATSTYPVSEGCNTAIGPVRIAPDGRHAAITFTGPPEAGTEGQASTEGSELWVTIVNLDTGEVAAGWQVVPADGEPWSLQTSPDSIANNHGGIQGIAWDDDRTLRVAWYALPEEGVHWITDVIQVDSLRLP